MNTDLLSWYTENLLLGIFRNEAFAFPLGLLSEQQPSRQPYIQYRHFRQASPRPGPAASRRRRQCRGPGVFHPKWGANIDLEAKAGTKRNLGEIDIFAPLKQDARTLYFVNLRGRFDDNSSREGNLGLGVRQMQESGWNLGAYAYLDRRRSEQGHYFNQTTLGAEALGRDWDFRANAYLPLGKKSRGLGSTGGESSASIVGTSVQITTAGTTTWEERALKGYDLEAGWRAPLFDSEGGRHLRFYLGAYRFSDGGVTVQGPRARVELAIDEVPVLGRGAGLFLSAETQHDDQRGGQSFLALRLRIPLGSVAERRSGLSLQERRMTAPVVRDVDIVTQRRAAATTPGVVEAATATAGGQSFTVVNGANASGADLQTALNNAGNNSTVIVTGTFSTTAMVTLSQGQTLIGGGPLAVRGASGQTATLNLAGATINSGSSASNAIRLNHGATLAGLTITAQPINAAAIDAQGFNGVTIRNNTITVFRTGGIYGVDLRSTNNAVFTGNTVSASSTAAGVVALLADSAANATVRGNTLGAATSGLRWVISGNQWTSFAGGSTGNVSTGAGCQFLGGGPAGSESVGFANISCQ